MAAGRLSQLPGEWFQAVVPDTELRRYEHGPVGIELDGRQLVVIVRDAHRHGVGADGRRGAHGACSGRGRRRDRAAALAPAPSRCLRRDVRRSPRQRGIGCRGAILPAATRGGAVW